MIKYDNLRYYNEICGYKKWIIYERFIFYLISIFMMLFFGFVDDVIGVCLLCVLG